MLGFAQSPSQAQTDLELWHRFSGPRAVAISQLAKNFNASQLVYRILPVAKDGEQDMVRAALDAQRKGHAPHMLHLDQVSGLALSLQRNAYRPVQLVMQEAGHAQKFNNYLPGIMDAATDTLGRVVSLPMGVASIAFYFNRAMFAKAGIAADVKLHTWRDVQDAALRIVDTEAAACAFASDRQAWVLIENILAMHDQSFTERAGPFSHVSGLSFSNRLLVRHVGMLSSWAKSGIFSYYGPQNEASERFEAGECAMLAGSSSLYPQLSAALGEQLVMQPMPVYDDITSPQSRTLSSGSGLWVLAGRSKTDYKGVGAFLAFLSLPDNLSLWHQTTGDLPLTLQAYETTRKTGFYQRNPWGEIAIRATRPSERTVRSYPPIPQLGKIRDILDQELEAVWAQHKTPKEALDDASERSTKLLRGK